MFMLQSSWHPVHYFAPVEVVTKHIAINVSVCLPVCLFVCLCICQLTYLKHHSSKFREIFYVQYVMYFRFCG